MEKKIYIFDDSKLSDEDFFEKGFRGDIILELDDQLYLFEFISIERLNNEYLYSKKTNSPCLIDVPTIVIEEVKTKSIIDSLLKLDENEVNTLPSINIKDAFKYYPKEYQDLNNWRQIH
jgi:hypothetical protein